jgi:hypothetical protein
MNTRKKGINKLVIDAEIINSDEDWLDTKRKRKNVKDRKEKKKDMEKEYEEESICEPLNLTPLVSELISGYLRVTSTMPDFVNYLQTEFMKYYTECINELIQSSTKYETCVVCHEIIQSNNLDFNYYNETVINNSVGHIQAICDIWNILIRMEMYQHDGITPCIFLFAMMFYVRLHHLHKSCATIGFILHNNYFFISCLLLSIKTYSESGIKNKYVKQILNLYNFAIDLFQLKDIEKCVCYMIDFDFSVNDAFIKYAISTIATKGKYLW